MDRPIPPAPPEWNKTIADLDKEVERGERLSVGNPELHWAREYERSQIPANMRFPRKGDVYEALEDMIVHCMTIWTAPCTGGATGLLEKGDKLIVDWEPQDPRPIGTRLKAVDYHKLEERFILEAQRKGPRYGGFYFSFRTVELNTKFKLIHYE